MKFISLALFIKDLTDKDFSLWMQIREEEGPLKGFWEFPGGNIENEETPLEAVIREVQEEVDLTLHKNCIKQFNNFAYKIKETKIEFFTFIVKDANPQKGKWFKIHLDSYKKDLPENIPPANHELINELCLAMKNINPKDFELLWIK